MNASDLVPLLWGFSAFAIVGGWFAIFSPETFGADDGKPRLFAQVFGGFLFALGAVVQLIALAWSLTIVFKNWP